MKDLEKKLLPIKDSVRRLFDAQKRMKETQTFYEQVKQKEQLSISNFMFSNFPQGTNSFEINLDEGEQYYANPTKLRVTRIRTQKIIWDCDKLRERLGKTLFGKVVTKEYKVNDMEGLVQYLKSCGVDAKKFKTYIEVQTKIDDKKIDNLFELGEITKADVSGCYTLNLGEPYIRLTEIGGKS